MGFPRQPPSGHCSTSHRLYLEGIAANWHIVIFVIGVILLLVERFAFPGFGVTGVLGIIGIVTGLALVMVDKIVFRFGPSIYGVKEITGAFAIVILSAVLSFLFSLWLSRKLFAPNRLFGSLALETTVDKADGFEVDTGSFNHSLEAMEWHIPCFARQGR